MGTVQMCECAFLCMYVKKKKYEKKEHDYLYFLRVSLNVFMSFVFFFFLLRCVSVDVKEWGQLDFRYETC